MYGLFYDSPTCFRFIIYQPRGYDGSTWFQSASINIALFTFDHLKKLRQSRRNHEKLSESVLYSRLQGRHKSHGGYTTWNKWWTGYFDRAQNKWIIFRGAWEFCVSFNKSLRPCVCPRLFSFLTIIWYCCSEGEGFFLPFRVGWWYNPQNTHVSRKTLMWASKWRTLTLTTAENGHHQCDTPVVCFWILSFSLLARRISSGALC